MLGTVSSDSIRCTNFINSNESDLRISSVDNTCTDSLVTALDDEALLICDATNEMARTKVNQSINQNSTLTVAHQNHNAIHTTFNQI